MGHDPEQVTFKMPGPIRDWQVKCVCGGTTATCNNGWMRSLDAKMESAASRLMRLPPEQEQPFRVSEEDQKIIATWSIMKVMAVHHRIVHHTQRKRMKEKIEPPEGWGVWIGYYKRGGKWNGEWLPRPFPVIRDDLLARRRSPTAKANSLTVTIVLQNLFIHVAYCRDRRLVTKWRFTGQNIPSISGHIFRIWPPVHHGIMWPGRVLSDQDAAVISDAILNGVMTVARRLGLVPPEAPKLTVL